MKTTAPYEYWILRLRTKRSRARHWYSAAFPSGTTPQRRLATTFRSAADALDATDVQQAAAKCRLVHVTVLPRGSRAVVEAARAYVAAMNLVTSEGRILTAAVRAMESGR